MARKKFAGHHKKRTYSMKGKHRIRDDYGDYHQGRQTRPEVVAGHVLGELPYFEEQQRRRRS